MVGVGRDTYEDRVRQVFELPCLSGPAESRIVYKVGVVIAGEKTLSIRLELPWSAQTHVHANVGFDCTDES